MKLSTEIIFYLITGILTTVLNVACFFLLIQCHIDYKIATTIAWIISVFFAYFTNKKYVFNSKAANIGGLLKEMLSFFWFRLFSYFIDLGSMVLMITFLKSNETMAKIVANILVVIINYIFSKWFVFNRHSSKHYCESKE